MILSLLFLLTIYLSVVVIFTGDWFFHLLETHLPHPLLRLIPLSALSSLWLWIRYLLLFCFVLLLVLAIYRLGTPRRFRSSRKLLLSSLFTAVSLVAGSLLFSWFIGLSSRYSMLYGSLAPSSSFWCGSTSAGTSCCWGRWPGGCGDSSVSPPETIDGGAFSVLQWEKPPRRYCVQNGKERIP